MTQVDLFVILAATVVVLFIGGMIFDRMKLEEPVIYHSFEEAEQWHANAKHDHPIRYWVTETVPFFFRVWNGRRRDLYYWVRNSLWDRYNVVVCRKLPPTWVDRDYLMLHACFQILTDFVDKEKPWEFSATREELLLAYQDCDFAEERAEDWQELRELYAWWQKQDTDGRKEKAHDLMLSRLIRLRGYLWT